MSDSAYQRSTLCHLGDDAREGRERLRVCPHDLLEAALASCIIMTLRMDADHPRQRNVMVTTRVRLDRKNPVETIFEYEIELRGSLSQDQRDRLREVAKKCPVRPTLSKIIGSRVR